jgi:hypothetical protein
VLGGEGEMEDTLSVVLGGTTVAITEESLNLKKYWMYFSIIASSLCFSA